MKEIEVKLTKDFVTSEKLVHYDQKMKEIKYGYQRETEELQRYFHKMEDKNNDHNRKLNEIMSIITGGEESALNSQRVGEG